MVNPENSPPLLCRLCNGQRLELAVPLTRTPIADHFVTNAKLNKTQECCPLELWLCCECGHLQLGCVVDPNVLFRDYLYVTTSSSGLVDHFEELAMQLIDQLPGPAGCDRLAIDIGNNDGSMLRSFQMRGMRVLGIDPAVELARRATDAGLETLPEYFSAGLAEKILDLYGAATIVTANNVFAHSGRLRDMVKGVALVLAEDGIFEFEVNYVLDIIDNFLFDTVYHEHLCYHAVGPLVRFLNEFGLELFQVIPIPSKGGSIRCFVQHSQGPQPIDSSVARFLDLENSRKVDCLDTYKSFSAKLNLAVSNVAHS